MIAPHNAVWTVEIFMIFIYLVLIPYMCIKSLRVLSFFSAVANVIMFVCLVITLQYCCRNLEPMHTLKSVGDWKTIPLFFGTAIYAFEGIGVVRGVLKYRIGNEYLMIALETGEAMKTFFCSWWRRIYSFISNAYSWQTATTHKHQLG